MTIGCETIESNVVDESSITMCFPLVTKRSIRVHYCNANPIVDDNSLTLVETINKSPLQCLTLFYFLDPIRVPRYVIS